MPSMSKRLAAGEPERRSRVCPGRNCSGSTPMPTRLVRWMRSKLSAITARTPSSSVPLAAQSRDDAGAVLLAGDHDQRHALLLVPHRRVVDRQSARRTGRCTVDAALDAGHQQVPQADVGERAAHHHLVVAAPRAVGVEVLRAGRRARSRYLPAGLSALIEPGGRDVIGGDRVAEQRQHARAARCRAAAAGVARHAVEERRRLDVGRRVVPRVADRRSAPAGRASARRRRRRWRTRRGTARASPASSAACDLLGRRPDVAQVDRLAVRSGAERLALPDRCRSVPASA